MSMYMYLHRSKIRTADAVEFRYGATCKAKECFGFKHIENPLVLEMFVYQENICRSPLIYTYDSQDGLM